MISRFFTLFPFTLSPLFFVLLITHTPDTHTGLFTRTAVALEHSYQSITNAVKNKYTQATEGLKPELATWDWYSIQMPPQTRSIAANNFVILSIDWQEVEPRELVYNHQKLQEYAHLCQELHKQQITPIINLFDGKTTPAWFSDQGGFANYRVLPAFAHYAQTLFKTLGNSVTLWITASNPADYARQAFISGTATPHKKGDFSTMLTTLEHMFMAHRDIYASFKKMPGGNQMRMGIGIAADPLLPSNTLNPLVTMKAEKMAKALQESVYNLLNTNRMDVNIQGVTQDNYIHSIESAFDFLLLNYTAPRHVHSNYELQTAASYPEGLYYAIKTVSERIARKVPLLINYRQSAPQASTALAADTPITLQRHLYALNKAIKEQYRVMGFILEKAENEPIVGLNQTPEAASNPTPKK